MPREFDHERLEAYSLAIDFVVLAEGLIERMPGRRRHMANQLHRASTSIALNIAEGAGEYSPKEKAHFYRIAQRSGTECAAILDILGRLGWMPAEKVKTGKDLLRHVVALLVGLCKSREKAATLEAPEGVQPQP